MEEPKRVRLMLVLGRQVALALDYLHSKSLVHRDVKPQNIMCTKDQSAYLIDYGITRQFRPDKPLTIEGFVLGTVPFMAPEQITGQADVFDGRMDVWGLGATLYYVITGRLPFPGVQYEEVSGKILSDPPVSPRKLMPELSKGLEELLLHSMEKSLDQRYQTAREMADVLEEEIRKS